MFCHNNVMHSSHMNTPSHGGKKIKPQFVQKGEKGKHSHSHTREHVQRKSRRMSMELGEQKETSPRYYCQNFPPRRDRARNEPQGVALGAVITNRPKIFFRCESRSSLSFLLSFHVISSKFFRTAFLNVMVGS